MLYFKASKKMANKKFLKLFMEFLKTVHSNAPFRSIGVYQSLYHSPLSKRVIYTGLKNLEVRGLLNLKDKEYSFRDASFNTVQDSDVNVPEYLLST